jgi:hypothetical protein
MTDPITPARRPRKTAIDKALDNLDAKIAAVRDELKMLERARQILVDNAKAGRYDP